jgi:hypothetical protein
MNEQSAVPSAAAKEAAERKLRERVTTIGAGQQRLIVDEVARMVIRDKLVDPGSMVFRTAAHRPLQVSHISDAETFIVHSHALTQIVAKSRPAKDKPGMNGRYARELYNGALWHRELLAHNLNTLYSLGTFVDRKKNPAKFLHRIVGDTLLGFLSRSYNRKLVTAPLLRTFLEVCAEHGAGPLEATTTYVRTRIKCVLPHVFEPVDGEFVAFGVAFGNSDFGDGMLDVSNLVFRLNALDLHKKKYGSISVMDRAFSKTHLGSIIKESDIEMSDETADKEVIAVQSAIRDVVNAQLSMDAIDKTLDAIRTASQEHIPWHTVRELLTAVLSKKDADKARVMLDVGVEELPPVNAGADGPQATGWWASNLVGWFADKEVDPDKKAQLQELAGDILVGRR